MTTLSTLHRADGSASYSSNGYSIVGAVNGPIEVQRRDELPEEAAIDVVIRPAAGVGGKTDQHVLRVSPYSRHRRSQRTTSYHCTAKYTSACHSSLGISAYIDTVDLANNYHSWRWKLEHRSSYLCR